MLEQQCTIETLCAASVYSDGNSTPDVGERGVPLRERPPLARCGHLGGSRSRRTHFLRSGKSGDVCAYMCQSGHHRRDLTGELAERGALWRDEGEADAASRGFKSPAALPDG